MEKLQNDLRKRINADSKCTIAVAVIMGVVTIIKFVGLLVSWNTREKLGDMYTETASLDTMIKSVVFYGFMCVLLIIFSTILNEIHKTGKPFSKKIIIKLQIMAVLLIVLGVLPDMVIMIVGFVGPASAFTVNLFEYDNVLPMVFGVCIGLVSEIFKYGYEIQEDIDQIA